MSACGRMRRAGLAGGLLIGLSCAASLAQQTDAQPPAQFEPTERDSAHELPRNFRDLPDAERRARVREFLAWRLDRADRTREALARSIKAVDDGDPIEKIFADFPSDLRPGSSWFGGGAASDGPRSGGRRNFGNGGGKGGPPPRGSDDPRDGPSDMDELGPVVPSGDETGPGMRRGAGQDRDARGPITDTERQAFDDFLSSAAPGVHAMLIQLREKDPERADRKLREGLPRIRWLLDLRERDPDAYALRLDDIRHGREALDAARALAEHDREHEGSKEPSAERDRLSERVRVALRNQYDVRGRLLAHDVARMDEDLARRRAELAARPAARDAAIARTIDKLSERAAEWMRRASGRNPGRRSADDSRPPKQD